MRDLAEGLRSLGCQVTTASYGGNPFYPDYRYDWDLNAPELRPPLARRAQFEKWADAHDVFVYIWAETSLLPGFEDLALLKERGKKIVAIFCGSDVRHAGAYHQQYGMPIGDSPLSPFDRALPLETYLTRIRLFEHFADLVLSVPNQACLQIRPYHHLHLPIALEEFPEHRPAREVPMVVHAPSRRGIKGTKRILETLDELRAEGVDFELRLLENLPNAEVKKALLEADAAIDQIEISLHGRFTLEALASGCAVTTSDRPGFEPIPAERPLWAIDGLHLKTQLREFLTNATKRRALAERARAFVATHHDRTRVAARLLALLDAPTPPEHHPRFFAESFTPSGAEPVHPLLLRLTEAILHTHGSPSAGAIARLAELGLCSREISRPTPVWEAGAMERDDTDAIARGLRAAEVAAGEGGLEAAKHQLEAALSLHPQHSVTLNAMATIAFLQQDHQAAHAHFASLVSLYGPTADWCIQWAEVSLAEQDVERALDTLQLALEQEPANPDLLERLGQLAIATGEVSAGQALLAQAQQLRSVASSAAPH